MTFAVQSLSWSRSLLWLFIEAPSSVDLQPSPSRPSSSPAFCSRTSPAHPCARGQGTPRAPRRLTASSTVPASTTEVDRSPYLAPPRRRPLAVASSSLQVLAVKHHVAALLRSSPEIARSGRVGSDPPVPALLLPTRGLPSRVCFGSARMRHQEPKNPTRTNKHLLRGFCQVP